MLWACYKGHAAAANCLVSRGANINAKGLYQGKLSQNSKMILSRKAVLFTIFQIDTVSCLSFAAGRGHLEVVQVLIDNSVKVDFGDKYGTTALIW
jgi:ankyrin repeat protein